MVLWQGLGTKVSVTAIYSDLILFKTDWLYPREGHFCTLPKEIFALLFVVFFCLNVLLFLFFNFDSAIQM